MSARSVVVASTAAIGVALVTALLGSAQSGVKPGDPLPGLSPVEFEEFRVGLEDFKEVETADDGLGPAFNGTSCAACHNVYREGDVRTGFRFKAGSL